MAYGPIYPHDPIEQIMDNIFMVRGSIDLNRLMRITRNMAIVRNGDELTVINPIRLDQKGEDQLRSLGTVKNVLRMGLHSVDDAYYVDTFKAEYWCPPIERETDQPPIDHVVTEETVLPFSNAQLFSFKGTMQPEVVLKFNVSGGFLLTCDCIQHYGDYRHNNLIARLLMPYIGFPKTTIVGPIWLKMMTPEGASLQGEFERLCKLEFSSLLCGHGSFLKSGAKDAVRKAVDKVFAS